MWLLSSANAARESGLLHVPQLARHESLYQPFGTESGSQDAHLTLQSIMTEAYFGFVEKIRIESP